MLPAIKHSLNTLVESYGFEMSIFAMAVAAFIRLNAVGLVYFIMIGILLLSYPRMMGSSRQWRVSALILTLIVLAE